MSLPNLIVRQALLVCIRYKPSSVPWPKPGPLSFIYYGNRLPSLATYPPTLDEQPLIVGIHGLATHEAYCQGVLLPLRWALTPPSHPYPLRGGYFLLRYYTLTNIKPLTCVVLYVARTFLPHLRGSDRAHMRAQRYKKIVFPR